jgi:hypothetical protein
MAFAMISVERRSTALGRTWIFLSLAIVLLSQTATASKKERTQVELNVKPPTAQIFIDGKAMGKASAGRVIDVTPGFHVVRLVFKRDEHEERIKFPPNQKTTYTFEFEDEAPAPDAVPTPVPDDDSIRKRNADPSSAPATKPAEPASP